MQEEKRVKVSDESGRQARNENEQSRAFSLYTLFCLSHSLSVLEKIRKNGGKKKEKREREREKEKEREKEREREKKRKRERVRERHRQ